MSSTTSRLLSAIRSKDLHEAHETFRTIMEQKVSLRLAEERKTTLKEVNELDAKTDERVAKDVVSFLKSRGYDAHLDSGYGGDFPYIKLGKGGQVNFGHLDSETWQGIVLDSKGYDYKLDDNRKLFDLGVSGKETNASVIASFIIAAIYKRGLR